MNASTSSKPSDLVSSFSFFKIHLWTWVFLQILKQQLLLVKMIFPNMLANESFRKPQFAKFAVHKSPCFLINVIRKVFLFTRFSLWILLFAVKSFKENYFALKSAFIKHSILHLKVFLVWGEIRIGIFLPFIFLIFLITFGLLIVKGLFALNFDPHWFKSFLCHWRFLKVFVLP